MDLKAADHPHHTTTVQQRQNADEQSIRCMQTSPRVACYW